MEEIFITIQKYITDHWLLNIILVFVFTKLIEISAIKVYPLTWLRNKLASGIRWIINEVNGEKDDKIFNEIKNLKEDMVSIKSDLESSRKEQKLDKIKRLRKEILSFADDLYDNRERSKHSYEEILFVTYPEYEGLITSMGMTNGRVDSSIKFVNEKYETHLRNGDFILDNDI